MSAADIPGDFGKETKAPYNENIPQQLEASTFRLGFTPSYVVVGAYRLLTDPLLRVPAWKKCKHGAIRGASVALIWVSGCRQPVREHN